MSDNVISTAAEEVKKWLDALEKILSKMESDKLAKTTAKLADDRHTEMVKELKGMREQLAKAPDSPEKADLTKQLDLAETKLDGAKSGIKIGGHRKTGEDAGLKKAPDGKWQKASVSNKVDVPKLNVTKLK
jgi:hypothetical protein